MNLANVRTSRLAAEIVVAGLTALAGLATILGALDFGIGWGQGGPQPGAFPFYVGLIIVGASLGNLIQALRKCERGAIFLDGAQARRVALFVATALYLGTVMYVQGGYRLVTSAAVAIATAAFFYIVLELWFRVPLLKGPLEAALSRL